MSPEARRKHTRARSTSRDDVKKRSSPSCAPRAPWGTNKRHAPPVLAPLSYFPHRQTAPVKRFDGEVFFWSCQTSTPSRTSMPMRSYLLRLHGRLCQSAPAPPTRSSFDASAAPHSSTRRVRATSAKTKPAQLHTHQASPKVQTPRGKLHYASRGWASARGGDDTDLAQSEFGQKHASGHLGRLGSWSSHVG